jgi:uncharacterized cupredoxin-like copper-binding protein
MRSRSLALAVTIMIVVVAGACGSGGDDAATGPRTVDVEMRDIAFSPSTVRVAEGDEVTFRFTNHGKVPHDAFIGDRAAQTAHEAEMAGDTGMHHGDGEAAVTVDPGDTSTLTHTFHDAGTFEIGCHQRGHYAAGMKITVTVA